MNIKQATRLLRSKLDEYELYDWDIKLGHGKVRLGSCYPTRKIIRISKHLITYATDEQVRDTILHEIAHALDWERNKKSGHGQSWKAICVEIGAISKRSWKEIDNMPEGKWAAKRKDNGEIIDRFHRKPKRLHGWFCKDGCPIVWEKID